MREPLRDRERLEHINAAINRIIRYTSDKSYDDLVADDMMYYAVVKNIELLVKQPICLQRISNYHILKHLGKW